MQTTPRLIGSHRERGRSVALPPRGRLPVLGVGTDADAHGFGWHLRRCPLRDRHGRLRVGAVRAEIESRLHLVPKVRRRVRLSSLGLAAPAWVDDPLFDLANHVRETTLRAPMAGN